MHLVQSPVNLIVKHDNKAIQNATNHINSMYLNSKYWISASEIGITHQWPHTQKRQRPSPLPQSAEKNNESYFNRRNRRHVRRILHTTHPASAGFVGGMLEGGLAPLLQLVGFVDKLRRPHEKTVRASPFYGVQPAYAGESGSSLSPHIHCRKIRLCFLHLDGDWR